MERFSVDGVELEYQSSGEGEPVLFVHGSHIADSFAPLEQVSTLYGYQLIRMHRRGFAGCTKCTEPVSIERQAQDCEAVFDHLGLERAHLVGHSYGAVTAMQVAAQASARVHTLTLMEPPLLGAPGADEALAELGPVVEAYLAGDPEAAVNGFMRWVSRPEAAEIVERMVPGGMAQAVKDADTFFQIELAALPEWTFGADDARAITMPALFILGAESIPVFGAGLEVARSWIPQLETVVLPSTSHLLQMESPVSVGNALAAFFERNPINV